MYENGLEPLRVQAPAAEKSGLLGRSAQIQAGDDAKDANAAQREGSRGAPFGRKVRRVRSV